MIEVLIPRSKIIDALEWCIETNAYACFYTKDDLEMFKRYWSNEENNVGTESIRFNFPDEDGEMASLFKLTWGGK